MTPKNMVKVKPAPMSGAAAGALGRLQKTAVAPAAGKNAKDLRK